MKHDEYLENLESLTDSPADVAAVLEHAGSCGLCSADRRLVDRELARGRDSRGSAAERVARAAAAAAAVVVFLLSLSRAAGNLSAPPARSTLVVGDASGVVAYTPSTVVIGTSGRPAAGKENSR